MTDIHIAKVRNSLPVRREPHWKQIQYGCSLGLRKGRSGDHWVARYRVGGAKRFTSIGRADQYSYEEALRQATTFFDSCRDGVNPKSTTVQQAYESYLQDRRQQKGDECADGIAAKWTTVLEGTALSKTKLIKLRAADIQSWANGMLEATSPATANRNLGMLKAILNFAYRMDLVASNRAWTVIRRFPDGNNARTGYLSPAERREFIASCPGWLANFLTGMAHTGARNVELRKARVQDVDLINRTLTLSSNKGRGGSKRTREFPLANQAAYEFFKSMTRGKLPGAYLFTSPSGQPLEKLEVSVAVRRVRKRGGFRSDLVAYLYRHSYITDLLRAGVNSMDAAKLTGTSVAKIESNYHKLLRHGLDDKLASVACL